MTVTSVSLAWTASTNTSVEFVVPTAEAVCGIVFPADLKGARVGFQGRDSATGSWHRLYNPDGTEATIEFPPAFVVGGILNTAIRVSSTIDSLVCCIRLQMLSFDNAGAATLQPANITSKIITRTI